MSAPFILSIRPGPPDSRTIAFVDVQLSGLRLFNLKLVDGPGGRRIYAPSAFGSSVANFTPSLAAELVRLATESLGDIVRHGPTSEAAQAA